MVNARILPGMTVIKTWLIALFITCVCSGLVNSVLVGTAHADQHGMRFENASTYLDGGMYYLDAFASLEIGEEPEEALLNGVELHFLVEIAVLRTRRWWMDTPVVERRLRYKLYFYDLTRHYRVENLQTGESVNYRSLTAALRHLGQINRFALIEADKIRKSKRYQASINFSLDGTRLPGPLAARAMVASEWNLQSEVFQWSLN